MSVNALGQGYSQGPNPFTNISSALSDIGKRKGSFQQELASRAMDHELSSIRETASDSRQSAENERNRQWQTSERRETQLHNARQAGAQIRADHEKLNAVNSHDWRKTQYAAIVDKNARRETFDHEHNRSYQEHRQGMEAADQARSISMSVADQAHRHATARADQDTKNTIKLSQKTGYGGNFSSGGSSSSRASTDARPLKEIAAEERAPKKKPSVAATPRTDLPTTSTPRPTRSSSAGSRRLRRA